MTTTSSKHSQQATQCKCLHPALLRNEHEVEQFFKRALEAAVVTKPIDHEVEPGSASFRCRQAQTYNQMTIRLFGSVTRQLRHTMTMDNGKEFAQFKALQKKPGLKVYFANSYSPWERGTNENTNGLLRQFFPKGMSFAKVTDEQVAKVVSLLNHRPRKCLGYRTPREVLPRGVALQS